MPALASDLRKNLEATVVKARDNAEGGARDALTALAVGASEPFGSMSEEERRLRNRLRARGRQLGDQRDPQKGTQSIERLVREMAYEHWHRMLFARFLAENQLLIEPSSGVSISLDECEELAAEEGTDLWGLAAQFAQAMLPQIFRLDDPVLAAKLPLEIRQQLQGLVAGLEAETFTASDSLGWTYQFWQTKRKKEVNDSGVKIGADEISPVTQLFTEDYMVDFLLDNTLGAWHAGKVFAANPQLAATAQSEEELRQGVTLPSCPWAYLRFIKTVDGPWAPASGTYEGWPKTAAELKCLDPCMGSGHFVVAMFERLAALRMAEKGAEEQAVVAAVIQENLFGLEIDPRCTQIAAFNLALAAWRRLGYCPLPAMNLACSGLAPNTSEASWLALAGDNERLRNGMTRLYRLFDKAAVLGSLINPRAGDADLLVAGFQELQPLLEQALAQETQDDTAHELAVTARGLAKAAEILSGQFMLVATNVPYLGRGKQTHALANYCESSYPDSKVDLATCFFERCLQFCEHSSSTALVVPQNWMFQTKFRSFREALLDRAQFKTLVQVGENGFDSAAAAGAFVALAVASKAKASDMDWFSAFSLADVATPLAKSQQLSKKPINITIQYLQKANPAMQIVLTGQRDNETPKLSKIATSSHGLGTFDSERFSQQFIERPRISSGWIPLQSAPTAGKLFSGCDMILRWQEGCGDLADLMSLKESEGYSSGKWKAGTGIWGKVGVSVSLMRKMPASVYLGVAFDPNAAAIVPEDPDNVVALLAFATSGALHDEVRKIHGAIYVPPHTFLHAPFDLAYWQKVAAEKYPNGLPKPFSSDSTRLSVAAPDRFQFSRLPRPRTRWPGSPGR